MNIRITSLIAAIVAKIVQESENDYRIGRPNVSEAVR
jgi:hypothetical protein